MPNLAPLGGANLGHSASFACTLFAVLMRVRLAGAYVALDVGIVGVVESRAHAFFIPRLDDFSLLFGAKVDPLMGGRIGQVVGPALETLVKNRIEDVPPCERALIALPDVACLVDERLSGLAVVAGLA